MALLDYLELLPEEKREAYKTEIEAVGKPLQILSREDAVALLNEIEQNEFVRREYQGRSDAKYAEMERKYQTEKIPALLEEERKKGQKTPVEIELDALKKQLADNDAKYAREKQTNRALAKAAELGIPASLVPRIIGSTDEETDDNFATVSKTLLDWRDGHVKSELEKIGSQKPPKGGQPPAGPITRDSLSTPEGRKAMLDAAARGENIVISD